MTALGQPRFLTLQEVLTLHETAIDEHGGSHGIRDAGLLESALAMPRQGFGDQYAHEFPFGMAAAYAYHICKNHPFVDGNKRTAFAAMVVFLRMNGWSLVASEETATSKIVEIATDISEKQAITAWLKVNSRRRPCLELRTFFRSIDAHAYGEMIKAMQQGKSYDEIRTSIAEAAEAMPIVGQLVAALNQMTPTAENESEWIPPLTEAILFASLYRIAEDMGYEW